METLKYTIIKSQKQYSSYCNELEALVTAGTASEAQQDAIDLLTLLIETWDRDHTTLPNADPIELLLGLMAERHLRAKDLVDLLEVSKGTVSDILHRRRGLSKEVIRRLADYFRVGQEAFNRPYELAVTKATLPRNAHVVHKAPATVAA